jgi:hypothetical protein
MTSAIVRERVWTYKRSMAASGPSGRASQFVGFACGMWLSPYPPASIFGAGACPRAFPWHDGRTAACSRKVAIGGKVVAGHRRGAGGGRALTRSSWPKWAGATVRHGR